MFNNLEAELKRKKITREKLALNLGMGISTVSTKLNGKYNFTLPEAFAIKEFLGIDMHIDELFAWEDSSA